MSAPTPSDLMLQLSQPTTRARSVFACMTRAVLVVLAVLTVTAPVGTRAAFGDKKAEKKAEKARKKEFNRGLKEIGKTKTRQAGVRRLRGLIATKKDDVVGERAVTTLREFGVGEEVEPILEARKKFRKIYKVQDLEVLETAERSLEELREYYAVIKTPVFKSSNVTLRFYDSRARYRKVTGHITSSGNFNVLSADRETGSIRGEIEWYFPQGTNTRNRDFRLSSLLYRELAHYLNAISFGNGFLPPLFEEGIPVYMETRLYSDPDQNNRTIRERRESAARNSLGTIKRYADFVNLLNSERSFGRGDATIARWYGNVYSVIDYVIHGEHNGKTSSLKEFLLDLRKRADPILQGSSKPLTGEQLLEAQIKKLFGTDLKTLHGGLLKHAQKYRQI